VLLLPLMLLDLRESAQISWIEPLGDHAIRYTLVGAWFLDNVPFAVAGWSLILAGGAALVLRARSSRRTGDPRARLALAVALPWLVMPIGVLVAITELAHPVFSPRYVAFSAPAVALLIAAALTVPRRRWIPVLGLALCLGLTLPSYVEQRTVTAKQDSSWAQVARLLTTERSAEPAGQRDAVVYGPLRHHPDATMQIVAEAYPAAFRRLVDLTAGASAAERGTLWQGRIPLADAHARLHGAPVIWLVTSDRRDWRPGVTEQLARWGYRPAAQWHTAGVNVVRYVL
jgi:mannosyltransferase